MASTFQRRAAFVGVPLVVWILFSGFWSSCRLRGGDSAEMPLSRLRPVLPEPSIRPPASPPSSLPSTSSSPPPSPPSLPALLGACQTPPSPVLGLRPSPVEFPASPLSLGFHLARVSAGHPEFQIFTHPPEADVFISQALLKGQSWDPYVLQVFRGALAGSAPGLVVDVGANIGYFTLLSASYGHRVVAFEPFRRNFERLAASVSLNGFSSRVQLYCNAVSNREAVFQFETSSDNQGGIGLKELAVDPGEVRLTGVVGVDFVTALRLDAVVDEKVILLKVDVEGAEGFVLDGAGGLLSRRLVDYVAIEFSGATRNSRECPAQALLSRMIEFGYEVYDVSPFPPTHAPFRVEDWPMMPPNLLFVRKT
jgi:FkbM family methyltransferase